MTTFSSVIYTRKNFSNKYIWIAANYIPVFFYRIHTFPFYVDEMEWSTQSTIHIVYNSIIMSQVIRQMSNPNYICSKRLVCIILCVFYIIRCIFHFYCCQWIERIDFISRCRERILHLFYQLKVNPYPCVILCAGPPPVHQLIRNDKTEKPPTVSVSSAPTFSSVLRPEDGHRGIESPHSQTGMYSLDFSNCLLHWSCKLLENLAPIR